MAIEYKRLTQKELDFFIQMMNSSQAFAEEGQKKKLI